MQLLLRIATKPARWCSGSMTGCSPGGRPFDSGTGLIIRLVGAERDGGSSVRTRHGSFFFCTHHTLQAAHEKKSIANTTVQRLLLKNPFIPLAFRLTVIAFAAAGLGVAGTIFHAVDRVNNDADPVNQCARRASTYMAVVVDCVAIPYLGYVTWDEYMSKPCVLLPLHPPHHRTGQLLTWMTLQPRFAIRPSQDPAPTLRPLLRRLRRLEPESRLRRPLRPSLGLLRPTLRHSEQQWRTCNVQCPCYVSE